MEMCDDGTSSNAQQKFQACSHSSSTQAYQKIMDVNEKNLITNTLCDTLENVSTVRRKHIEECFSDDDLVMMTENHLKEMKTFLIRITRGKMEMKDLEDCESYRKQIETISTYSSHLKVFEEERKVTKQDFRGDINRQGSQEGLTIKAKIEDNKFPKLESKHVMAKQNVQTVVATEQEKSSPDTAFTTDSSHLKVLEDEKKAPKKDFGEGIKRQGNEEELEITEKNEETKFPNTEGKLVMAKKIVQATVEPEPKNSASPVSCLCITILLISLTFVFNL